MAEVEQRKSNEMIGAELGYRYAGSPIIGDEPGGPEDDFRRYVPTTWPGARLPQSGSTAMSRSRTGSDLGIRCCAFPRMKVVNDKSFKASAHLSRCST